MRAKLIAIHIVLNNDRLTRVDWDLFGLSIQSPAHPTLHCQPWNKQPHAVIMHYHHHMLLLGSITDLIETRRSRSLHTILHKIIAYANIRGNDLADAAAKLAVIDYYTLSPSQTLLGTIGEIAPRPAHWVMYTAKPPALIPALFTGTTCVTLHQP